MVKVTEGELNQSLMIILSLWTWKKSLTGHKTISICGFPYPCTWDKPVGVERGGILVHSWQTRLIIFNTVGVLMLSEHLHSSDNQLIVSKKQILRFSNVYLLKVTPRFCDLPTLLNGQTGAYSYQLSQKYTHSSCRFLDVHQLITDFFSTSWQLSMVQLQTSGITSEMQGSLPTQRDTPTTTSNPTWATLNG